jgi:hypothetical protein
LSLRTKLGAMVDLIKPLYRAVILSNG